MLRQTKVPLFGLAFLVVLYTANSVISGYYGEFPSIETDIVYIFGFTLLLVWWVYADRHARRYSALRV